ncbi:echinoderm microtubule-associated protein-like 4 isoform X3 [Lineus longissimus]|uniref:echinoderm microtubule-associated protein-like 4 isoform X3 n=1 Tax=Lineus longissimus TaxID=88925 RepID=UPI00315DEE4E
MLQNEDPDRRRSGDSGINDWASRNGHSGSGGQVMSEPKIHYRGDRQRVLERAENLLKGLGNRVRRPEPSRSPPSVNEEAEGRYSEPELETTDDEQDFTKYLKNPHLRHQQEKEKDLKYGHERENCGLNVTYREENENAEAGYKGDILDEDLEEHRKSEDELEVDRKSDLDGDDKEAQKDTKEHRSKIPVRKKKGPGNEKILGKIPRYDDPNDQLSQASYAEIDSTMPSRIGYNRPNGNEYYDDEEDMYRHDHGPLDAKGKLVSFFRNGDPHFKGLKTSISQKQFSTFETLLMWLNEKVPTTTGVRYLFVHPEGYEVKDINEIEGGKSYVVSGVKKLNTSVVYGNSKENFWHNNKMSAGKLRRADRQLLREGPGGPYSHDKNYTGASPGQQRPRIFTVISNTHRDSKEKVILNPQTAQTFEDLLRQDFTNMLKLATPPVQTLYTAREPFKRVESYSQLFREFKNHDAFIACGMELKPYELKNRAAPGVRNDPSEERDKDNREIRDRTRNEREAYDTGTDRSRRNERDSYDRSRKANRNDLLVDEDYDQQERTPRNHTSYQNYSPPPNRGRPCRDDPREVRSDIRDNRPPPYREVNDRDRYEPARHQRNRTPYKNRGQRYREENDSGDEYPQHTTPPRSREPYHSRDPPRPRESYHSRDTYTYREPEQTRNGPRENPRYAAYNDDQYSPPRGGGYTQNSRTHLPYIDKQRYKGDELNRIPNGVGPRNGPKGSEEKRYNVARVDIHGKRREFFAPTIPDSNDDGAMPDRTLALDWVYGYRGKDSRNNLFVITTGETLYFVSNIAVIYDKRRDRQRHYTEHTEEISCMALHPSQPLVATGQIGGKNKDAPAHVRIWDHRTLANFAIIGMGVFVKGITCLSFSKENDGEYLLAVDQSNKHVMTVWQWEKEACIAKTTIYPYPTTVGTVIGAQFHPQDDSVIVSFGKQHISFWKIFWEEANDDREEHPNGRILRDKKSGIFEDEVPKYVTALAFNENGDVITGDSTGSLIVWSRDYENAYTRNHSFSMDLKHCHQKTVLCLTVMPDGTLLTGGGAEVKAWDGNNGYKVLKERLIPDTQGSVRSIVAQHFEGADGQIYIGTTKNIILEGSLQEKFTPLIQGHSDELWAMTTHPFEHSFFTASYDMQVIKWSTLNHKIIWKTNIEKPCLCVAIDPKGSLVAVGTTVGRIIIMDAMSGMHISSLQVSVDQLGCMAFNPDGNLLAVGSHDHGVYVFGVLDEGQCLRKHKSGILTGHRNFVTQLDWSSDGKYLQSVSGDYDLRYWNIESMTRERSGSKLCDTDWHSQTCVLAHCTLGAWSNLEKGEDINCVSRSTFRDLLGVGENRGVIKLYKYPSSVHKAECTSIKAYTSHVTSVRFTFDDSFLISTGGTDDAIMQWSMVET